MRIVKKAKVFKSIRYGNILAKKKVLLFGDDILVARTLGKVFKNRGFIFKRIKDFKNFKKWVWEFGPQLILIDVNPFSDSLKLCKFIKKTRRSGYIPVIILGKESENKNIIRSLQPGQKIIYSNHWILLFLSPG